MCCLRFRSAAGASFLLARSHENHTDQSALAPVTHHLWLLMMSRHLLRIKYSHSNTAAKPRQKKENVPPCLAGGGGEEMGGG